MTNHSLCEVESVGELRIGLQSKPRSFTDFKNVTLGHLCAWVKRTFKRVPSVSSLLKHVEGVFCSCSKPKVDRVAAFPVVTGVANALACGDRTASQQVRNSVRSVLSAHERSLTISFAVKATNPFPTLIEAEDPYLLPEELRVKTCVSRESCGSVLIRHKCNFGLRFLFRLLEASQRLQRSPLSPT